MAIFQEGRWGENNTVGEADRRRGLYGEGFPRGEGTLRANPADWVAMSKWSEDEDSSEGRDSETETGMAETLGRGEENLMSNPPWWVFEGNKSQLYQKKNVTMQGLNKVKDATEEAATRFRVSRVWKMTTMSDSWLKPQEGLQIILVTVNS